MKRDIILLGTSILLIILLFICSGIGFSHSTLKGEILIQLSLAIMFIIMIVLNILTMKNTKGPISFMRFFYLYIVVTIIMIIITFYIFLGMFTVGIVAGPETTIEEYIFPNSSKESLKTIYFADMGHNITGPIYLIYERQFFSGIRCKTIIISTEDTEARFDLEKIYKEIKNRDSGFCKYKLSNSKKFYKYRTDN